MATRSRFIAQERMGTWLVVTLGVAVLALVAAIWGVMESRTGSMVAQVQVLKLDERIRALEAARPAEPAVAMPAPEAQEAGK